MLTVARELRPDIEFINTSFITLPFPNETFDGIWSHASLVHLEEAADVQTALTEFYRVLKPGGMLYVLVKEQMGEQETEIVADTLSGHERFFRYYKQAELSNLLEAAGFIVNEQLREEDVHGRKEISWIKFFAVKT